MRKRAKVDETHRPIVEAFRKGGWSVLSLATVGGGCPDLIVCRTPYAARFPLCETVYLIEVKSPKGKLREGQEDFAAKFPVHVLRSVDDAIAFMSAR